MLLIPLASSEPLPQPTSWRGCTQPTSGIPRDAHTDHDGSSSSSSTTTTTTTTAIDPAVPRAESTESGLRRSKRARTRSSTARAEDDDDDDDHHLAGPPSPERGPASELPTPVTSPRSPSSSSCTRGASSGSTPATSDVGASPPPPCTPPPLSPTPMTMTKQTKQTKTDDVASRAIAYQVPDNVTVPPFAQPTQDARADLGRIWEAVANARRIVVVCGAGISVSSPANIPDFRSSTGLFKKLKEKHPTAGLSSGKDLFDARLFNSESTSALFYSMIAELRHLADEAEPTAFHHLLKRLDVEGRLLRVYTQNIDNLEERAGLSFGLGETGDSTSTVRKLGLGKRKRAFGGSAAAARTLGNSSTWGRCASDSAALLHARRQQRNSGAWEGTDANDDDNGGGGGGGGHDHADYVTTTRGLGDARDDAEAGTPMFPRTIPLHGSLSTLTCTVCKYRLDIGRVDGGGADGDGDGDDDGQGTEGAGVRRARYRDGRREASPGAADRAAEAVRLLGQGLPVACFKCEDYEQVREVAGLRSRGCGWLKVGVVLYGGQNEGAEQVGECLQRDILGLRDPKEPPVPETAREREHRQRRERKSEAKVGEQAEGTAAGAEAEQEAGMGGPRDADHGGGWIKREPLDGSDASASQSSVDVELARMTPPEDADEVMASLFATPDDGSPPTPSTRRGLGHKGTADLAAASRASFRRCFSSVNAVRAASRSGQDAPSRSQARTSSSSTVTTTTNEGGRRVGGGGGGRRASSAARPTRLKPLPPDLLIVAGTSLKVPGTKRIVREFAKACHARDGRVARSGSSSSDDEEEQEEDDDDDDDDEGGGRAGRDRRGGRSTPTSARGSATTTTTRTNRQQQQRQQLRRPIRTVLLNYDFPVPSREWEGVFDTWVRGDVQRSALGLWEASLYGEEGQLAAATGTGGGQRRASTSSVLSSSQSSTQHGPSEATLRAGATVETRGEAKAEDAGASSDPSIVGTPHHQHQNDALRALSWQACFEALVQRRAAASAARGRGARAAAAAASNEPTEKRSSSTGAEVGAAKTTKRTTTTTKPRSKVESKAKPKTTARRAQTTKAVAVRRGAAKKPSAKATGGGTAAARKRASGGGASRKTTTTTTAKTTKKTSGAPKASATRRGGKAAATPTAARATAKPKPQAKAKGKPASAAAKPKRRSSASAAASASTVKPSSSPWKNVAAARIDAHFAGVKSAGGTRTVGGAAAKRGV